MMVARHAEGYLYSGHHTEGRVFKNVFRKVFRHGLHAILTTVCVACGVLSSHVRAAAPDTDGLPGAEPVITALKPEGMEGRGYRLEYTVDAPLDMTWKFKTDFGSQVLLTNKMILSHRLVSREGDEVITETVYSNKPKLVFRWKTSLVPDQHLLKFELLNPEACAMDYHYGSIRLQAAGASATRVTQVAYFDFFGVSLWVSYPFRGGMSHFLNYTARWEQQAVLAYWQSLEAD